ncbi:protein arginine N-methyltransferase 3 [Caerostris extrusa]|uniref:type I protein arginine methyltransferase n=1 Tax=Caerostris extrusa TaxID=172846 RepID=A0AAV4XRB4_CAEEX|nr:protein arginine N-methyltransferase 3 [Caerostris extrusa]
MTTIMNSSALVNEEESPESTDTMEGVEESESDEEWENIDEAVSFSYQTLCLFCTEVFNSAELMFAHCETGHIFDAFNFFKKMNVNAISYIQFINFIRKHKLSPSAVMHISTACPWSTDFYMKPFDLNDPLLVFDIEGYMEEKENERTDGKDSVTIPNSEFQTLMQELTSQTERLKNAYDRIDRMKEAAKTVLLCNNQQCSSMNNRSSYQDNASSGNDEDNYYFSTYDHFAIHHEMLQDKVRTLAYKDAILNNPQIFHNKRVLDLGCGTAILSMFAAKAGASFVMGVDKSDVIFHAMDIVRENGFEKVIDLFKGRVEDMPDPEEKMDVIVSEWMGYFLLFEGMLDSVIYARDKFLAPGGHIFPDKCTIYIQAVCDMGQYKKYNEYVGFWDNVYGFKMNAMKNDVIKEANVEAVKPETACCEPAVIKELDLMTCKASDAEFSSSFDVVITHTCAVTALVGYFDCFFDKDLSHKAILSTAPSSASTHWKQTMFLIANPIQVTKGAYFSFLYSFC